MSQGRDRVAARKRCCACRRKLGLEKFHHDRNRRDGRTTSCMECACERARAWYGSHRTRVARTQRAWRRADLERKRAHDAVYRALRRGDLERPTCCEACGDRKPLQAHHHDHRRRLLVTWLCVSCHRLLHMAWRAGFRERPPGLPVPNRTARPIRTRRAA